MNGETVEKRETVEEDTFLILNSVTFEAFDSSATRYEWRIGSDPRIRTEKKFTLYFNDPAVIEESPIKVQLKIITEPDNCLSETFVDSVDHKLYFVPEHKWPLLGSYTGYDNTNPSELYTVNIVRDKTKTYPDTTLLIENLPNACNDKPALLTNASAFQFGIDRFDTPETGTTHECIFRVYDKKVGYLLPDRKTIVIEYGFTDKTEQDNSLQKRIFTGIRQY